MISECSDALVPQSIFAQSYRILRSDVKEIVTDVLKERGGFTWRVKSSKKGGHTVQCNLRFTTNNQMTVVACIYYSTVPCHQDVEQPYTLRY